MALKYKDLRLIDQRTKDLVARYINSLKKDKNTIIPSDVVAICTFFYNFGEYFTVCGDDMKIDQQGMRISTNPKTIGQRNTCYTNVAITNKYNCIYSWTFKRVRTNANRIKIGIDTSNKSAIDTSFQFDDEKDDKTCYYWVGSDAIFMSHENMYGRIDSRIGGWNVEKLIKIEINTKNKTFELFIDGESRGILFRNMQFDGDKEYHLGIATSSNLGSQNVIELVAFEAAFPKK